MIEEIYAKCPENVRCGQRPGRGGLVRCPSTYTHERQKFTLLPSIEVLARFRDYNIGGIGLEPHDFMRSLEKVALLKKFKSQDFHEIS